MDSLVPMPKAAAGDFASDAALFSNYWRQVDERLRRLWRNDALLSVSDCRARVTAT